MPIVETCDLVKTYKMGDTIVRALDGLNMQVERGEFMAIMGRSGSGKSTLLNMLGCLDRPTSGQVIIDEIDVTKVRKSQLPKIRREKIGFVFQHFNLLPTMTALENVMLPLKYAGVNSGQRAARAKEALTQVGLEERMNHRPAELSGGEQQRAAVARAIVTKPAIVLGDELTGELDSKTSRAVIELLREFNRETRQTFVLVTHDPAVAEQTDRVVHLLDGKVEFEERHPR
ncbi:MAG TPA: ABC transporter ATP-binding protein [Anaerolineae bacterium]|nr:ABC transporter ATP-binding protein [Anaerolineae bacterium]